MKTPTLRHALLVLAVSLPLASCGIFGADSDRYEKLDRLRVLAIKAERPDLEGDETATFSAEVYQPQDGELGYAWSWCASRGDSASGFACNVSEQDLKRAWMAAGLDGPAPSYDLGTEREARLTNPLRPTLVDALCRAPHLDERLEMACFQGLEPSLELTIKDSRHEVTAIKSVPLLSDDIPDEERNTNPASDFPVTLSDDQDGAALAADEPLRAGHRYTMRAEVDESAAESFTPVTRPGEPPSAPRRETLVMTWFVTLGEVLAPDGDDGFGGDGNPRTTFVDGHNAFPDLLRNAWQLPLTAGPSAELHLVLRDERGGTAWTSRRFEVVGAQK